jgi:hypothetical protein
MGTYVLALWLDMPHSISIGRLVLQRKVTESCKLLQLSFSM